MHARAEREMKAGVERQGRHGHERDGGVRRQRDNWLARAGSSTSGAWAAEGPASDGGKVPEREREKEEANSIVRRSLGGGGAGRSEEIIPGRRLSRHTARVRGRMLRPACWS